MPASRKNPQAIIGDMNQFEEPVHSSPRSEPQQPHQQQQQTMSRRQSQSSQKSTQSRFGHTASHITGILSPVSPTSTSAAGETQGSRVTPKQISTFPGAFPTPARDSPTKDKPAHDADRRYNQALLSPTSPTTMITSQVVGGRYLTNRISMPNLAGDAAHPHWPSQDSYHSSNSGPTRANSANGPPPEKMYLQDTNNVMRSSSSGTRSAYHLPRRNTSEISVGRYGDENASFKQELHNTQDPRQSQSGMMPRSTTEYYNQQMLAAGLYHPSAGVPPAQQPYDYNSTGATPYQQPRPYQHRIAICGADQPQYSRGHHLGLYSDLSLEALAMHNRSQSALDPPRSHASHGSVHGRSRSQVNLRREGSVAFNPYDHQHQQQPSYYPLPMPPQAQSAPMNRLSLGQGVAGPSITIPPVRGARPQSALASYGALTASPTESSPSTSATSVTYPYRFPNSPPTPGTGSTGTPTSAGTSMSAVSVMGSTFGPREQRRKSETARMAPSASMTASTFTARKFSVDAGTTLASSTTSASFLAHIALPPAPPNMSGRETVTNTDSYNNHSVEDTSDPQEGLGTYTAKKPKATLFRTFKQIINPRKVAEKDAVKHHREHFAWMEMQKSLRRVPSPDIGKERPFFAPDDGLDELQGQDPFEVLKRCHVMRDTSPGPGATTVNSLLDVGPAAFTQVDKVARNVNQRGPHITPQLLSQKYLTRPYAKAPLSKLRVLFVWVSENIRLEGGPTRDVSGGRYKLGPGGDPMLTAQSNVNAAGESPNIRTGSNGGVGSPSPSAAAAAWMPGPDDHSRGLLQEDSPELAQEVLASRTSKTGEGFANLFAEMALAAGIEDVGVVKGYIKGPMDVFSKEVPPTNHAWNVVRINGTYRFIDCCLASPFHPAHYPNRPQTASSFYFLTSPMDLVLSHFPVCFMYQYITPSIPPQIFLRLPFVRPAFFDFGLSLPEFKRRTRLDIKDDESIEVVIRIDGGGPSPGSVGAGASTTGGGHNSVGGHNGAFAGSVSGLFGGECLGRGCGEGIELRAEVEAMTAEGRVIKRRALAQIMIWNPYQTQVAAMTAQAQPQQQPVQCGCASSSVNVNSSTGVAAMAAGQHYSPHQRLFLPHHCSGIRIAKIKAVLPSETVVGAGGIRKGVVHIYAGRKVEMAPADATPYSLALSLPIRHTGTMPKTPFNFVLPHFSPYEFYVKSPQSEMLYYPHTYKFCVLSLAAQGQATAVSANAVAIAENDAVMAMAVIAETSSSNMGATVGGSTNGTTSPRHKKANNSNGTAGSTGSASIAPMYRPQPNAQQSLRSGFNPPAGARGPLTATSTSSSIPSMSSPPSMHPSATTASMGMFRLTGGQHYPRLHQHQQYHSQYQMGSSISMASTSSMSVNGVPSTSSNTGGGVAIPRPERLVLRTQMNRIYKLAYDPVRQCHEAEVEVKERGIWECVRMDDGGKSRVGREGASGVVIATWRCV
ncbi:cytokinesis protein 3 [Linnemannia hyalina]|uniref:Cytokinesis protein 3 n=1 Tax=Linnemannia hyalina TaxID=64524 RepID=A0A9P8BVP6_9FUNG|nr:cytokinesis protein 3 [Linnemannia hyalina]